MLKYARLVRKVERRVAEIHDSLANGLEVIEIEDLSEREALTLKSYLEDQGYDIKYRDGKRGRGSYVIHILGGRR